MNWLLVTKVYIVWATKVQRSYLSWHWRVMQILKKNWLVVWKNKEIWQIFNRPLESVKIRTLIPWSFCPKYGWDLFVQVFCAREINCPCKEVFSQIAQAIYCPPQGFWGGCTIFVILELYFFYYKSQWYVEVFYIFYIFFCIFTYFTYLEMIKYYQKTCGWNRSLRKLKICNKLSQIHYAKKSFLMVYVGTCDCYENIKIKLWSSISILKAWHVEILCYKKKMIVNFNYVL